MSERSDSDQQPILQVSRGGDVTISRRAILLIAGLAGVPGGVAIYQSHDADTKAEEVAVVATGAATDVDNTFALMRKEQLDDRKAIAELRETVNELVDEVKSLRYRLRWRRPGARPEPERTAPAPEKIPDDQRPPLPPTPAAANGAAQLPVDKASPP